MYSDAQAEKKQPPTAKGRQLLYEIYNFIIQHFAKKSKPFYYSSLFSIASTHSVVKR